jgi:hypothetical protein
VAEQPDRGHGPQQRAEFGPCRSDQERATEQQEYQPDIAHEMLIEGSGGGHAGHEVPAFAHSSMKTPLANMAAPSHIATARQIDFDMIDPFVGVDGRSRE